jgi:hypothetical protein
MDHRCLYGHRVPAAFTFAIQNRTCPTCGAQTVTINGYQAARKVTSEAGIDAVTVFQIIRIIESEWLIATPPAPTEGAAVVASPPVAAPPVTPVEPPAAARPAASPSVTTPPPPVVAAPAAPAAETAASDDEDLVVDEGLDVVAASATPEPRIAIKPVMRGKGKDADKKENPATTPKLAGFDTAEEDFFKGN